MRLERRRRSTLAGCGLSVIAAGALATDASAADRSWGNTAGGTFSTTTNWINGIVAGVNDVAVFDRSRGTSQTTYTVAFGASAQNQALSVTNDLVTFNLNGRTYTTTQITGNQIGTSSSTTLRAALTLNNGVFNVTGSLTPQVLVGAAAGATGSLTLTNNAVIAGSPRLLIGVASGTGGFTVNSGTATLNTLDLGSGVGGRGSALITLPFATVTSSTLLVGNAGRGTLSVNTSGLLQINGPATVGNAAGSTGVVTIDTGGRWVQAGALTIGNAGAGTVNILGGGSLGGAGATAVLGNTASGPGVLNIDNSSAALNNTTVGNSGAATLSVANGGSFSGAAGNLGAGTSGTGSLIITGAASAASFTSLAVGDAGAGTVSISGGARLSTGTGSTVLGRQAAGRGYLELSGVGSRWDNTGSVHIGSTGAGSLGGLGAGTVYVHGGAVVSHLAGTFERTVVGTDGLLTVEGVGSEWAGFQQLFVGGTGRVEVLAGATFKTANASINAGAAIVDGAGSEWNLLTGRGIEVGRSGAASLSLTNGGRISPSSGNVSVFGGSAGTITIDGAGSEYSSGGTLAVAVSGGDGTVIISNGGRLATTGGAIGSNLPNHGTISVSGANSVWVNQGSVAINGQMDISAGGRVINVDAFVADRGANAVARVTVQDGTWANSGNLYVGGSAMQAFGTGSVTVRAGGLVTADELIVWDNGTVNLSGGELRAGTIDFRGSTFNYNGGGRLRLTGSPSLTPLFLNKVFGTARLLDVNKTFVVDGAPTLESLLILRGGTFAVGALAFGSPLQFDSGTFNLTNSDLTVGSTGLFGNTLVLDDRFINVTRATNIEPGGRLFLLGGKLTSGGGITNNGEIIVNSPFVGTFVNPLVNNGEIRVSTNATAIFLGNVTGSGSFSGEGTKFFRGPSNSVGAIDSPGNTILELGATLAVNRVRENGLSIRDNSTLNVRPSGTDAATSRLNLLFVTSGRLNLANNALVVDYTGFSPLDGIRALLTSGFAGGSWNGGGINSSVAASQPNRALGYAEASDVGSPPTFAGQPIDSTTVLVRFTLPGDATLDRVVNIGDFSLLAANFNLPSYWAKGDFNFDGTTGIADFALLAANFNQGVPAATARTPVPEPATSVALAVAAAGLAGGRRSARRTRFAPAANPTATA